MWYQATLPAGIIFGMYAFSHFGLWGMNKLTNNGKNARYGVDKFDRMMSTRDARITGHAYVASDGMGTVY
eukprot:CFRG2438T1